MNDHFTMLNNEKWECSSDVVFSSSFWNF